MIGFVFDGVKRTVHLPPAKAAAYIKETHTLLRRKTVPLKKLQMLVGGGPRRSYPHIHGIHIQAKDHGFKGRTKTATSPQARCAALPKYCISNGARPGSDGSSQS